MRDGGTIALDWILASDGKVQQPNGLFSVVCLLLVASVAILLKDAIDSWTLLLVTRYSLEERDFSAAMGIMWFNGNLRIMTLASTHHSNAMYCVNQVRPL